MESCETRLSAEQRDWLRKTEKAYDVRARVERAREVSSDLIDAVLAAIAVHETNRIVVVSDRISGQIPVSLAARAFKTLAHALIEVEALRVVRLWDKPDFDSTSIQTAYFLSRTAGFRETTDAIFNSRADLRLRDGRQAKRTWRWGRLDALVPAASKAAILTRAGNYRDKQVAHLLKATRRELKAGPIANPTFKDIRTLLNRTIAVTQLLNMSIRGASYDWAPAFAKARNDTECLWSGASFTVAE